MASVVVIGAGVSGLTTAICLAEAGAEVRVWAERPPLETTSALAGAMWGPSFQQPVDRTLAWTGQSLRDFTALAAVPGSGVRMAPVLTVGELPPVDRLPPEATMIPDLRACTAGELPAGYPVGFHATMPVIDMPVASRCPACGTPPPADHRRVDSGACDTPAWVPPGCRCRGSGWA